MRADKLPDATIFCRTTNRSVHPTWTMRFSFGVALPLFELEEAKAVEHDVGERDASGLKLLVHFLFLVDMN